MLTSETKRRIDACRDILVGKLPLPTDQVELINRERIQRTTDAGWSRDAESANGALSSQPGATPQVQEEHHRTKTFQDEYRAFLAKYGITYDDRYVWD